MTGMGQIGAILKGGKATIFAAAATGGRVRHCPGALLGGFELAVEEEGWIGEFFRGGRLKEALKKISAGLRP
jgi:hypothetical protein